MSTVSRRSFTPQRKAEVVRRHLAGQEAVSNLATEFQIQPSQIHAWVKVVLDQAEAVFQRQGGSRRADEGEDRRIAQLEEARERRKQARRAATEVAG